MTGDDNTAGISELLALASLVRSKLGSSDPARYEGDDWCELMPAEAEVFGIEPAEFPLLMLTFHCFEAFVDMAQGTEFDTTHEALLIAARTARPDLVQYDQSGEAFANFCRATGLLTVRQAFQMWWKHQAWMLRAGIQLFADGS